MNQHAAALSVSALLLLGIGCEADNATVELSDPVADGEVAGGVPPEEATDADLPVAYDEPVDVAPAPRGRDTQ